MTWRRDSVTARWSGARPPCPHEGGPPVHRPTPRPPRPPGEPQAHVHLTSPSVESSCTRQRP
eukprot:scaffold11585_cov63-Phaeocystis_antarctica.AAC.1